jgi:hypothetical protein
MQTRDSSGSRLKKFGKTQTKRRENDAMMASCILQSGRALTFHKSTLDKISLPVTVQMIRFVSLSGIHLHNDRRNAASLSSNAMMTRFHQGFRPRKSLILQTSKQTFVLEVL